MGSEQLTVPDRLHARTANTENGDFRSVDNRRKPATAQRTQAADSKDTALHVIGFQLPVFRLGGNLCHLGCQFPDGLSVDIPDDGHHQAGRRVPENIDAVMVLPVDMPALTRQDLVALIGAYKHADEGIEFVGPMVGTRPGNPVLFSRRIATQILRGEGEFGSGAWRHHQPGWLLEWQTDNPHYVADIDTPEDLERYL